MSNTPNATQIADAAKVLAKVKAHDPGASNPDRAVALAWAEAFAVHGLELRDLLDGVRDLFADDKRPRDRVLAADVIRKARAVRADRAERERVAGTPEQLSAKRAAIEACTLCDPNGWADGLSGVYRCQHPKALA